MKFIQKKMLLFYFVLFLNAINCQIKRQPLFKCEHNDYDETHPLPNRLVKQDVSSKRRNEGEETPEFEDFNIYLDFANLEEDMKKLNMESQKDFFENAMKKAVDTLTTLLKVKPLAHRNDEEGYNLADEDLKKLNLTKWNESLFGNGSIAQKKTFQNQGINLAIFGTLTTLSSSTLATATAQAYQNGNNQPYVGLVKINKDVDYSKPNSDVYFESILVHEFTHILGFSKHFFSTISDRMFEQNDKYGVNRIYLKGDKLLEVAKKYFNCDTIEGVELENQGGSGTAGSHWESRILLGEYMNGYAYTEEQVISEFTLAVLEDSGYYKANYYTGGLMRYGKNKGCDFLKEKCVNSDHTINPLFENEFYDTISGAEYNNIVDSSCSSGRQSRTYNVWWPTNTVPEIYYFNENITGYEPADYCPVPMSYYSEEVLSYFVGHCSIKGSGEYGTLVNYKGHYGYKSGDVQKITGETYSDHSYCYLSSLSKEEFYSSNVRGNCYETFCSDRSLTIKIFDDYVVCPRSGGKIKVDGYLGYLLCPDYNLVCSGTVICNNIFDCVDKRSEIKPESYNYDYNIKTSQNIVKANSAEVESNNYELSNNGICPQFCKHCRGNKVCLKCEDGYAKKMELDKSVICTDPSEVENGYYQNEEGVYIKCIDNCVACVDLKTCEKCADEKIYSKNQCIEPPNGVSLINNCLKHSKDYSTCEKCEQGYAFNQTDKTKCHAESVFQNYYRKGNGLSFYPCSTLNENCTECFYDPLKLRTFCTKCINDLVLLNKGEGQCKTKEEILNNTKYYLINATHAGVCKKDIENCLSCDSIDNCLQCEISYVFDNDIKKCISKNEYIETNGDDESSEAKPKSTNNEDNSALTESKSKGRRKVKKKKNSGNYLSVSNVLLLEIIYIIFLLIKF